MFIDQAKVIIKAGNGGNGIVSFRRERYVSKGGPDGGDGGNGGNIVFVASNNQNTLANFRFQKELHADDGLNGSKAKMHGRSGKDLAVAVPVGTQVIIDGKLAFDFTVDGQREIVAVGGKGGFGNAHFVSSTRQAPKIAEKGDPGEEVEAVLELKSIADIGLVGMPNAGKSTLLSRISGARPKIANYPFTTLNPHLGVAVVSEGQELLLADIPGLIEGASEGKGLGDDFLRHVERTKVLLHMIDAYTNDVAEAYQVIQSELKNYKVDLSIKPQVIALTKVEGLDQEIIDSQIESLQNVAPGVPVHAISAMSGVGLKTLLYDLYSVVEKEKSRLEKEAANKPVVIGLEEAAVDEDRWHIEVNEELSRIIITGEKIERFAKRTDFESEDGARRLRDIMRKLGIIKELEKRDVEPGMRIYFGDNLEDYIEY